MPSDYWIVWGTRARVVAGGHSLLPMMKLRIANPEYLVHINDLALELGYVITDPTLVRIGAMTRHRELLESDTLAAVCPIFRDAERVIADPVVRNRGTLGGSLCQADPAEDLSTVCAVLDAVCLARGPSGEREITIDDFMVGPYETALAYNEMLVEVRIPVRHHTSSAYAKVERRVGDWAVTAAGSSDHTRRRRDSRRPGGSDRGECRLDRAGGGFGGLGRPARQRRGLRRRGRRAGEACEPVTDVRGTAEYKRHLASELTIRTLRTAADGARTKELVAIASAAQPGAAGRYQRGEAHMQVNMTVNGEQVTADVEPRMLLVHFLRDQLRLTGTHWGCDTSNCGTCVVDVDGVPVKSCTMLAVMASGHSVRTVEGFAVNGQLDPVQEGFMQCHGLQCGFCTPGMMITARALLDRDPDPDEQTIREAISGQICRCTGYTTIVRSIQWAAKHPNVAAGHVMTTIETRPPSPEDTADNDQKPCGYGRMLRKEDPRFIRGRGRDVVDVVAAAPDESGSSLRSPAVPARLLIVVGGVFWRGRTVFDGGHEVATGVALCAAHWMERTIVV